MTGHLRTQHPPCGVSAPGVTGMIGLGCIGKFRRNDPDTQFLPTMPHSMFHTAFKSQCSFQKYLSKTISILFSLWKLLFFMHKFYQSCLNTQEMPNSKTGETTKMGTTGSDGTIEITQEYPFCINLSFWPQPFIFNPADLQCECRGASHYTSHVLFCFFLLKLNA